jgi:putative ABC transport system substrate-binding protein
MKRREFITLLGGAAAAWPRVAHPQQVLPVVGFLSARSGADSAGAVESFRKGLAEAGYTEGRNVAVEYRWADARFEQLPALAEDLVHRNVAVIAAVGGQQTPRAAQAVTSSIPIVFGIGEDPIKSGLVPSLNRPGGNMTGATFSSSQLGAKRLGLLHEVVPKAETIGMLFNQNSPQGKEQMADVGAAAGKLGQRLVLLNGGSDAEIEMSFASLAPQQVGALLVAADPFFDPRRDRLIALSAEHRMPTLYHFRDFPLAGGMMSYGASIADLYRQVGVYVGRILKGDKPAELPIMQPSKFELVINLKTAKALGLEFHPQLLATADEVIE